MAKTIVIGLHQQHNFDWTELHPHVNKTKIVLKIFSCRVSYTGFFFRTLFFFFQCTCCWELLQNTGLTNIPVGFELLLLPSKTHMALFCLLNDNTHLRTNSIAITMYTKLISSSLICHFIQLAKLQSTLQKGFFLKAHKSVSDKCPILIPILTIL